MVGFDRYRRVGLLCFVFLSFIGLSVKADEAQSLGDLLNNSGVQPTTVEPIEQEEPTQINNIQSLLRDRCGRIPKKGLLEAIELTNALQLNKGLSGAQVGQDGGSCSVNSYPSEDSAIGSSIPWPDPSSGELVTMTVMSLEQAQDFFDEKTRDVDEWKLKNTEVCVPRAHRIALDLDKRNIKSGKLFVTASGWQKVKSVVSLDERAVNSEALKPYFSNVRFHASNTILVKTSKGFEQMVIDPFLFPAGPVPIEKFNELFMEGSASGVNQIQLKPATVFSPESSGSRLEFDKKDEEKMEEMLAGANDEKSERNAALRKVMKDPERVNYLKNRCAELAN